MRREIDQRGGAGGLHVAVEPVGNARAPEAVKVGAARVGKGRAHFQTVGLDQIERAHNAVQAREQAHVLLDIGDFGGAAVVGVDAFVNVAVKQIQRRFGVVGGKGRRPGGVALGVEQGDFVGNLHQRRQVLRREFFQFGHQQLRLIQ